MQHETTHTEKEFDLGVLFIHGIGTQTRGQTLATAAGPLLRWIANRCEALEQQSDSPEKNRWRCQLDEIEWGLAGTSPLPSPSFAPSGPDANALLRRPWLHETVFKDPTDLTAPAHTKMTVLSLEHDERVTADRWLLAESWWAKFLFSSDLQRAGLVES